LDSNNGAITALATIVIAAFTGTLYIATNRQVQLTREAFVADKRAFVFASGVFGFYEFDSATGQWNWRVSPVWRNSGETPTRQLRIYTDCWFSNVIIPVDYRFSQIDSQQGPGSGMVGPKIDGNGGAAPHSPHQPALTPQDIVDIQTGRKFSYLSGWARYFSTTPGTSEHVTRFCWQIEFIGNPHTFDPNVNPNSVTVRNRHDRRGNCADDECRLQGLG
jgi:hypothetical protein